jgi:hypothetical protein
MMLRLLATGREVRTMMGSETPLARVSFVAADRDREAGRMDAIAGCEFVDDRIRLLE